MTTTTETNERREEEEGVVVKTAHDVVALAHCVTALSVSKKNRDVQNNNNTFCEEIEKKSVSDFSEQGRERLRGKRRERVDADECILRARDVRERSIREIV